MPRKPNIEFNSKFEIGDIVSLPSSLGFSNTTTVDPVTRQAVSLGLDLPYWLVKATATTGGNDLAARPFQITDILPYESSIPGSHHLLRLQEAKAGLVWEQAVGKKRAIYARIHLLQDAKVIGRIGVRPDKLIPTEYPFRNLNKLGFKAALNRKL